MIYNENESTGFYMIEIAVMTEFKVSNRNTRKEWNMFKVNNKNTRTALIAVIVNL